MTRHVCVQVVGVCSREYIPQGTRFGPLVGEIYTADSVPKDANRKYFWRVSAALENTQQHTHFLRTRRDPFLWRHTHLKSVSGTGSLWACCFLCVYEEKARGCDVIVTQIACHTGVPVSACMLAHSEPSLPVTKWDRARSPATCLTRLCVCVCAWRGGLAWKEFNHKQAVIKVFR